MFILSNEMRASPVVRVSNFGFANSWMILFLSSRTTTKQDGKLADETTTLKETLFDVNSE